jgi:hypothetical protein
VNRSLRPVVVLTALAGLIGGCAAASHIPQLQPPSVPASAPARLPQPGAGGAFQRGIDIDWYAWRGQPVTADAQHTMAYIAGDLHANAVSVSFPFFMDGTAPGSVHATSATPTPAELAAVVQIAQAYGLRVELRPLLDEPSLETSRVDWVPSNLTTFFRAYLRFLTPYAEMAQREHVSEFIAGTELTGFRHAAGWRHLDTVLAHVYHGQLACADNWGSVSAGSCGTAVQAVDAYAPQHGNLRAAWERWDRAQPHGIVLTEVGIAAEPLATTRPYRTHWNASGADPGLQSRWFTAACQAAAREHLGGIYFWSLGLSGAPPPAPTAADQTAIGGPAARAIAACFAQVERTDV